MKEEEKNILKGIAQFGNVTVRKAMRSRLDVQGVEETVNFGELKKKVEEQQYSRFPVFNESLDSITGILHAKDLIPYLDEKDDFNWSTLVRPAFFIHEQMLVEDLLREFQSKRIHFAIVVDEFGGTDGIITMEDILEEIVGEIADEFDDGIEAFIWITEDKARARATLHIEDLADELKIEIDKEDFEDDQLEEVHADADDEVNFRKLFIKRYHQIPEFNKLAKRTPAVTLDYLILSNLCSFLLISRYHNGLLLEIEPEILVRNLIT